MYRILIADDEQNIREGLEDLVQRKASRWEVAALAKDGKDAMEKARETLPDAILTDICMPHLNGLDFLETIRTEMPDTKLLVLSGYDQFDYAVQALRIGVSDFLLKPLESFRLLEVLDRLAEELDGQAEKRSQAEEMHLQTKKDGILLLEQFFVRALFGTIEQKQGEQMDPRLAGSNYCCVVCDASEEFRETVERFLQQRLEEDVYAISLRLGAPGQMVMVFWSQCKAENPQNFFLQLHQLLAAVAVQCRKTADQDVHFFMGKIVTSPQKLRHSYRQALDAKNYVFPEQAQQITTYKDTLESSFAVCPQIPRQMEKDIAAAVKCGNERAFFEGCDALMQWFREERIQNAVYIRMCILSLCYAILRDNREGQNMSYYEFTNFQKEIMGASSLEELRTHFENFVQLSWMNQRNVGMQHQSLKQRVESIVEENLGNIDFSLDVVAGRLFISPNYLRQLFKQESGQTFTEFLTEKRMLHAKMLLGNPKVKIGDVAEWCGYADSRYFSSCFKKFWQMTPSEYQMMMQNQKS